MFDKPSDELRRARRRWQFDRRQFLGGMSAALIGAGTVAALGSADSVFAQKSPAEPFKLGVASGDPTPDGVVLWTRLAPDPLNGGGMPPRRFVVQWRVASDENMQKIVQSGSTLALPDLGHSVHVELRGLQPDRWYWYQFSVGGEQSAVGRTRTAPALGSSPDRLRFAVANCNDWQFGLFAAYGAIAREEIDLVIHLGDYIYEYGPEAGGPRQHDGPEIGSLESYRNRHALYKTDLQLQEAHAACPWLVTWDDHETENNYANQISENVGEDPQSFLQRRANAYKAYYEHMPLRLSSLPTGPNLQLYRKSKFGDLAEFNILDTRQYRTDQPCGDGLKPRCAEALAADATMFGAAQESWLFNNLGTTSARWNVLAQQTMMAQFDFFSDIVVGNGNVVKGYNMDQWDGYVAARNRLLNFLQTARPSNPVVLTGDIHSSWVHDLKANFDNPQSETLATEFISTSITSEFPVNLVPAVQFAVPENPHTKYFDGLRRGYLRCDLNRETWVSDFRVVATAANGRVLDPTPVATTSASFVVNNGVPGAQPA